MVGPPELVGTAFIDNDAAFTIAVPFKVSVCAFAVPFAENVIAPVTVVVVAVEAV